MELVTAEFEMFGRVSYTDRLAYGRQEAIEASGWYMGVPKLSGCSEVGLKTIAHYIGARRQHIACYIVDKPIFQTCRDGVRRRGSSVRQFWWAQSMDLETARPIHNCLSCSNTLYMYDIDVGCSLKGFGRSNV